jgi:hypothetical protein
VLVAGRVVPADQVALLNGQRLGLVWTGVAEIGKKLRRQIGLRKLHRNYFDRPIGHREPPVLPPIFAERPIVVEGKLSITACRSAAMAAFD